MSPRTEACARPLLGGAGMAPAGRGVCGEERWKLVGLLCCCNAVLYVNRANMSVAVTFMYAEDQTAERAQVLAAFYYGYPLVQIFAGQWAAQLGGKRVLFVAALLWSMATLLIIPAYGLGAWAVMLARAAVGLAEGVNYPAQMALLSAWIPMEERSRAFSLLSAGEPVGTMGAMLGCAFLAHVAGWQSVFALSALLAVLWACAFACLVERSPEASRKISAEELAYIQRSRGQLDLQAAVGWRGVPWGKFLRSQALLAIMVPHICYNWGYYLCLSVLPDYFQTNFHMDYAEMGFVTVLPYLVLCVVENLGGWVADNVLLQRWGLPLAWTRKLCSALGLGGMGCCYLVLRTLPACPDSSCSSAGLAVACITGAVGIGGLCFSGFQVNFLDISPRFASHLYGISNTVASLPGILGVMSLAWFNGNFDSVFAFAALLQLIGAAWYVALGRADDQRYEVPAGPLAEECVEGCRL